MEKPSCHDEMTIRHRFDRLCQMSRGGEAINYYRHMDYRREHEITFSELSEKELGGLATMDEYGVENSHFTVHGYDIEVKDALIPASNEESAVLARALDECREGQRLRKRCRHSLRGSGM